MIVTIVDDIPGPPRLIYYQITDDYGIARQYGPVITSDPTFDAEAHKTLILNNAVVSLAESEFNQVIG